MYKELENLAETDVVNNGIDPKYSAKYSLQRQLAKTWKYNTKVQSEPNVFFEAVSVSCVFLFIWTQLYDFMSKDKVKYSRQKNISLVYILSVCRFL